MGKKELSQYDGQQTLKSSHDLDADALRTINPNREVPSIYDRVDITYDGNDSVSQAVFYKDDYLENTKVTTVSDVAGNLNNKYFILYSGLDATKFHVWYNVDSGGVDPAPAGSTGIPIAISSNDDSTIVALATKLLVGANSNFTTELGGNDVYIKNVAKGDTTDSTDNNTGFTISTLEQGVSTVLKTINLTYENNIKYVWNDAEHIFDVQPEITTIPSGLRTSIKNTTLSIGTTAVPIPAIALSNRNSINVYNKGTSILYVGPSNVTADDNASTGGWEVEANSYFSLDITDGIVLYGIRATLSEAVKVMELA